LAAAVVLALIGCSVAIGSLDECTRDADCASRGITLVCQDRLCVDDHACAVVGSNDKNAIVHGVLIPLTDDGTTPDLNAPHWRDVLKLVADELNPPVRQGLDGKPLRLIVCDTRQDANRARDLAQRLVDRGVQTLMTGGSSETLNVASVTVPARALVLTGYAQSPEITALVASPDGTRLVWRTIVPDSYIAKVVSAEIASGSDAGKPRVAVLARNDSYGEGFYAAFSAAYPGEQRAFYFDPNGSQDSAALSGAAGYAPNVAVVWGFPEDIVRLVNALGKYDALTQASFYFNDQILTPGVLAKLANPSRVEGAFAAAAAPADPTSPAFSWLQQHFQQQYGLDPAATPSVAPYSDAMMLVAIAYAVASVSEDPLDGTHLARILGRVSAVDAGMLVPLDPPHFNVAVSELTAGRNIDVQGASGRLDFDPTTGEAPSDVNIYQITNGALDVVKVVHP
jgi:branched-chain amino acid transport system substrate-binding protein